LSGRATSLLCCRQGCKAGALAKNTETQDT
jgi:hypothetical protein